MKDSHVDQKKLRQSDYNNAFKIDLRNEIQDSFGTNPTPWFQWVFNHIGMDKHAAVLDLGCGSGQFWQQNKERISPYLQLTMADLSHGMVQDARQRLERTYAGPEFAVSDGQALTFLNDSFEIVLAIGVLDHVPNVNQTLGEIWRVLRPSGLLVASAGVHAKVVREQKECQPSKIEVETNQIKSEALWNGLYHRTDREAGTTGGSGNTHRNAQERSRNGLGFKRWKRSCVRFCAKSERALWGSI
jgi:ubiquinone/menaquinone biosynthesis C-methylase UbiE